MKKTIYIFTDGSCFGNPGPGGWASLFLDDGKNNIIKKLCGYSLATTNNRMEMKGFLRALLYAKENFSKNKIIIACDSNLIIQTILQGWKKKANLDLWLEIDKARESLDVEYKWVKGHHTNKFNNMCDEIAQRMSSKAQRLLKEKK
jgi:ribonuclease HI